MNTTKKILCDLDGVMTDFIGATAKLNGIHTEKAHGLMSTGVPIWEACGFPSKSKFWKAVNRAGVSFWADMRPLPGALDFFAELKKLDVPVLVCTAPSFDPSSARGKTIWCQNYLGAKQQVCFVRDKYLLADKNTLLIDDTDTKVSKFYDAGGKVVLFPSPKNENIDIWELGWGRAIEYVLDKVKEYS